MMEFKKKIELLIDDLKAKGLKKYNIAPPLYRLFWKMDWEVPPPVFASFLTNTLILGTFFGVLWGLFMFSLWRWQGYPIWIDISSSVCAGVLFGLFMGWYWRRKKKKLGLGDWKDYREG